MKVELRLILCILILLPLSCTKDVDSVDPVDLNAIESGTYEGTIYYSSENYIFREEIQFQSPLDTFYHLTDTINVRLEINDMNYVADMGDGNFVVENDTVHFKEVNDYCPPTADCAYWVSGQQFRYEVFEDSLYLENNLDWYVFSVLADLSLSKDSVRIFNRAELIKID